ncbi:Uncharacterised protein [Streptococcus pneumoniae]|nr:Uncharacterised protein [Streptococcus pneumoniae]
MVPLDFDKSPSIIRNVVVLPAPFPPKNPNISPFGISIFKLFTATCSSNFFVKSLISKLIIHTLNSQDDLFIQLYIHSQPQYFAL